MRILTTGGGGNLGGVLAPAVEEAGHEPVLMDNRTLESPYDAVRADVRDRTEILEALLWGFTYWSIEKAKRVLGYMPQYNFPEFFDALKRGDRSHYPYADLPWWGV